MAGSFRQLRDRHREALWLRVVEELTNKEAAQRTRRATGTVKSLVSRGLARLRWDLEPDCRQGSAPGQAA